MSVRLIRAIILLGIILGMGLAGRATIYRSISDEDPDPLGPTEGRPSEPEDPSRLRVVRAVGRRVKPLHPGKTPTQPGDWLSRHAESGQTFAQYLAGHPNRPTRLRTTVYLRTWGDFEGERHSQLVADVREMIGRFYGLPVRSLDGLSLAGVPAYARPKHPDRGDERLTTAYALDVLRQGRPRDAVAVFGLTTADLTPREGRSWVFGQASLLDRVGVCSIFRHGGAETDGATVLRRTLKTALHETGHMLGLMHCIAYECAMNGSGGREEADSRPLRFCPECEMKVLWACRLDPEERYASLVEYARRRGLDPEARFWEASLVVLERP